MLKEDSAARSYLGMDPYSSFVSHQARFPLYFNTKLLVGVFSTNYLQLDLDRRDYCMRGCFRICFNLRLQIAYGLFLAEHGFA